MSDPHGQQLRSSPQGRLRRYRVAEIVERHPQSGIQINLRLPSEQGLSFRNIRAALFGIVLGKVVEADVALRFRSREDTVSAFQYCEFVGIANVHWKMLV